MTEDERAKGADLPADAVAVCGEPTGTVNAQSVLFEEEGQYGPIFILQLADFLKALGTRSAGTLSCMQAVCETVFHKHLGPKGTYSLHGGAFFIFRFGRLEAAEARRRARHAIDDIGHRLLSDHFIPFATEDGADKPQTGTKAANSVRTAVREAAERDWETLPDTPPGAIDHATAEGTDGEDRTRLRRDAHAHARSSAGKGGGATGGRTPSRLKRKAAI